MRLHPALRGGENASLFCDSCVSGHRLVWRGMLGGCDWSLELLVQVGVDDGSSSKKLNLFAEKHFSPENLSALFSPSNSS